MRGFLPVNRTSWITVWPDCGVFAAVASVALLVCEIGLGPDFLVGDDAVPICGSVSCGPGFEGADRDIKGKSHSSHVYCKPEAGDPLILCDTLG